MSELLLTPVSIALVKEMTKSQIEELKRDGKNILRVIAQLGEELEAAKEKSPTAEPQSAVPVQKAESTLGAGINVMAGEQGIVITGYDTERKETVRSGEEL